MLQLGAPAATVASSVDWNTIILAIIGGCFTIVTAIIPIIINARMKDKQAADTLNTALQNALGKIEQAVEKGATPTQAKAEGVQYMVDHAGPEMKRLNIDNTATIEDKLDAREGVQKLASKNLAAILPTVVAPRQLYRSSDKD